MRITLFAILAALLCGKCTGVEISDQGRLAFIGDSLTARSIYTTQIETYLKLCAGYRNLKARQFGVPGNVTLSIAKRMSDILAWKPTIATLQCGMNDGFYGCYSDWMGNNYVGGFRSVIRDLKGINCSILVATPTVMDPDFGKPNSIYAKKCDAATYNQTLEKLSEFTEKIAVEEKVPKVELFQLMRRIMIQCKEKYGSNFQLVGTDGIHPGNNGNLVMTYAFLKAMKIDGRIADIRMNANGSQVSDGHKITSNGHYDIELESSRYPYCLDTEMAKVLFSLPFQQDFNSFRLTAAGLSSGRYMLHWGAFTKVFSSGILTKGINLADEFKENPFTERFNLIYKLIEAKQKYDALLVFELFPALQKATEKQETEKIKNILLKYRKRMEEEIRKEISPLKHRIRIQKI